MAFKGRDPVRNKIVINNNYIIEQIKTFIYLGYCISYQNEKDVTVNPLNTELNPVCE